MSQIINTYIFTEGVFGIVRNWKERNVQQLGFQYICVIKSHAVSVSNGIGVVDVYYCMSKEGHNVI